MTKMKNRKALFALLPLLALATACSGSRFQEAQPLIEENNSSHLYAMNGKEYKVHFEALYRSQVQKPENLRVNPLISEIKRTTQFLFGPLTYRNLGGIQKGEKIQPLLDKAYLQDGVMMVPYQYEATWMLESTALLLGSLRLPLPYSVESLNTPNWQSCTDRSDEEHRTWSFFWYFWEPRRLGCEHKLNVQYQEVQVEVGEETPQTTWSYPEYGRLIHEENGVPTLAMTFAFGYVKDVSSPKPFQDSDPGMREFQSFYQSAKYQLQSLGLKESPIHQSDITYGDAVIGSQFSGEKNGVQIRVSIVAAANVDQMDLFAHSYARKHEGFFGWFGHSRVGSGFDADILRYKLVSQPDLFSISPKYQLIYWAGCNSYSYYTQPFFEMKAQLNPQVDPRGTQNLDLISNTLPSLFSFNGANAKVLLQALVNWENPTSYQSIINQIEFYARAWGSKVIVNVLGDEDNSAN